MDSRFKKFPPGWPERLQRIVPTGLQHKVFAAFLSARPHAFRVNTLLTTEDTALAGLRRSNIATEAEPLLPLCHYIRKTSLKKIQGTPTYLKGEIYLQNPASQIPALLLAPRPGERVLDACAAPGGKTSQLAALMRNSGDLTALEPDTIRFERLRHNVALLGANAMMLNLRLSTFANSSPLTFDRILVDAPCSGDGVFSLANTSSFAHWSLEFVEKIARQQKKILAAAVSLLKPGGRLVYSTCSLAPEENEAVVDAVLKDHPEVATIPITSPLFTKPLPVLTAPLTSWNGHRFAPAVSFARRILPSRGFEGFFVCVFKRTAAEASPPHCE